MKINIDDTCYFISYTHGSLAVSSYKVASIIKKHDGIYYHCCDDIHRYRSDFLFATPLEAIETFVASAEKVAAKIRKSS